MITTCQAAPLFVPLLSRTPHGMRKLFGLKPGLIHMYRAASCNTQLLSSGPKPSSPPKGLVHKESSSLCHDRFLVAECQINNHHFWMKFHQTVAIFLTPSCLTRTDLIRPLVSPSDYSTNILWSQLLRHCSSIAAGCSASNLEVYLVRRHVRNVRVDLIDLQLLDLRPALRIAGQLGPVGTSKGDHQTNAGLESTENRLKITDDQISRSGTVGRNGNCKRYLGSFGDPLDIDNFHQCGLDWPWCSFSSLLKLCSLFKNATEPGTNGTSFSVFRQEMLTHLTCGKGF